MNETQVTMIGNVATQVTFTAVGEGGVPVANFRMAATERRYDRATQSWVDGDTHWVTVVAWRALASNVVSSLNKGDPVLVSGRLKVREWLDGEVRRTAVEIDAKSVGHDLSRGTSAFRWAVRGRAEPAGGAAVGGAGGAEVLLGEAVPEWIASAVAARRAAVEARAAGGPAGAAGADGVEGVEGGERQVALT